MALPKASIANSASFQISGTPFVHETTGATAETINLNYVTKAITVTSNGTGATIHFGDASSTTFSLLDGETYRFEIKTKNIVVTAGASATVSVVAEVTNVEKGQLAQHTQTDWATVS